MTNRIAELRDLIHSAHVLAHNPDHLDLEAVEMDLENALKVVRELLDAAALENTCEGHVRDNQGLCHRCGIEMED